MVDECLQLTITEETKASLALDSPKIPISINDSVPCVIKRSTINCTDIADVLSEHEASVLHTEKIPGPQLEKIAFDEGVGILQHMFDILGIIDHNCRR